MKEFIADGGMEGLSVKHDMLDGTSSSTSPAPKPKPNPKPPKKEKSDLEVLKINIKAAHKKVTDLAIDAARVPDDLRRTPGVPGSFVESMEKDMENWSKVFSEMTTKLQWILVNVGQTAAEGPAILEAVEKAKEDYAIQVNLARKMMKNTAAKPKEKAKRTPKGP